MAPRGSPFTAKGVGMGYSLHSGVVIVADGTDEASARVERVLTSDPKALGVMRHADAGYDEAITVAHEREVMIPGRPTLGFLNACCSSIIPVPSTPCPATKTIRWGHSQRRSHY